MAEAKAKGRPVVIRFRGQGAQFPFVDKIHGPSSPLGPLGVDDFVLRRGDGIFAYQLAVAVDDAQMGIQLVVRGDDLLSSTPRQLAVLSALGQPAPAYAHVPLLLSATGERLAKRRHPPGVSALRDAGVTPETIVGHLAHSAGLADTPTPRAMEDLVSDFTWERLSKTASCVPGPLAFQQNTPNGLR